ncbi:MAG: LacI family transcriptional regulator [Propionibacteriaceae bacterium]|jgi:LacI family transcriptional regulator|nr:LacI family transcriptional regulator [Propionibacteriaceae bacterium]
MKKPRPEVSIREVASLVGVSTATVSNALRGKGHVSQATTARIVAAVDKLGYVPNVAASQLRQGYSKVFGVAVMNIANPFFSEIVLGVEEVAEVTDYSVVVGNSYNSAKREANYLSLFERHRYDGVLLAPTLDELPNLDGFARRGTPVVLIDHVDPTGGHICVSVDDLLGGRLAAEHLLAGGARHVAFVGDPQRLPQMRGRCQGCADAVTGIGARFTVIETPPLTVRTGREAGHHLSGLPLVDRPDAVLCGNDEGALGLMQALIADNVSIPDEIALVGYDDIDFASTAIVPLTSLRQPSHQMGVRAAELLLGSIAGEAGLESVRFQPELVVRRSTRSYV